MPQFTQEEIEVANAYRSDGTFYHAHKQGWSGSVFRTPEYDAFLQNTFNHQQSLDSAIRKSSVPEAMVVYSGHGKGAGVVGALEGDASSFIGLRYKYPGYISTSVSEQVARDFLIKRAEKGSRPVMLELHLPAGYHALDMSEIPGGGSELEFLIGREAPFEIVEAKLNTWQAVKDEVLLLSLRPV